MTLPAPAVGSGWPPSQAVHAAPYRGCAPREREEYAARRALFLQSYRLSTRGDEDEEEAMAMGLRGQVARRLRDARVAGWAAAARAASQARGAALWWLGAGLGKAWRGWRRPRPLQLRVHGGALLGVGRLGCFGGRRPGREYHFLQGFA